MYVCMYLANAQHSEILCPTNKSVIDFSAGCAYAGKRFDGEVLHKGVVINEIFFPLNLCLFPFVKILLSSFPNVMVCWANKCVFLLDCSITIVVSKSILF